MFGEAEEVSVPLYLTLLNLGKGSEVAVAVLERLMGTDADLTPQIVALLDDFNWGNRVSPQLAAVAFLIDDEFERRARQRAEAGCPISRERLDGFDCAVRHSAAGPGSFVSHSSKALSALTAFCEWLPAASAWLGPLLLREDIQKGLASDQDGGGRLATGWLKGFTALLEGLSGGVPAPIRYPACDRARGMGEAGIVDFQVSAGGRE